MEIKNVYFKNKLYNYLLFILVNLGNNIRINVIEKLLIYEKMIFINENDFM